MSSPQHPSQIHACTPAEHPTSTPTSPSSSSRACSSAHPSTDGTSLSSSTMCTPSGPRSACLDSDVPSASNLADLCTSNPFANLAHSKALGFEDPHRAPRRDASYVPTNTGASASATVATERTPSPKKGVDRGRAVWRGSELFNECHRLLDPGRTLFESGTDERRRAVQLSGFGREVLPPRRLGAETGRDRGGPRGHGRQRDAPAYDGKETVKVSELCV